MTKIFLAAAAVIGFSAAVAAASGPVTPLSFWTDVSPSNCAAHLRAKVVSAKAAKNGDVAVRVRLDRNRKSHTATVNGAKVSDFKVGSAFCAQDYSDYSD
jgi:type 1 fimbria pilin